MISVLFLALIAIARFSYGQTATTYSIDCSAEQGYNPGSVYFATYSLNNATVAYIWSTVGTPSLLLFTVPIGTLSKPIWTCPTIDADGNYDFSNFDFPQNATAMSSLVFTQAIEFNDKESDAVFRQANVLSSISLTNLTWNAPVVNASTFNFSSAPIVYNNSVGNYTFSVTIVTELNFGNGRQSSLPALPFGDNSVTCTLVINGYPYTNYTSKLAVLTYTPVLGTINSQTVQSIDDEYMPKIFQYTTITSTGDTDVSVYMAFRPVAFGSLIPNDGNFTLAQLGNLQSDSNETGIVNSIVKYAPHSSCSYGYLTFGQNGDGVYDFPYLLLDFVHGAGTPQVDSLSTALILTMIATISLPGAALIISVVYIGLARRKFKQSGYQAIN